MEERRFDALVKGLTSGSESRRQVVRALGMSGLAAVLGRLVAADDAEAKKKRKKRKKCKNGTTRCGKKACCRADQLCQNGACVDKTIVECVNDRDCARPGFVCQDGVCVDPGNGACQDAGDCNANELCINGECRCVFPSKPCNGACCAADEACVDGVCLVGQGTCAAGQSICDENSVTCNGNPACTCADRLDDDEPRCIQFIDDSRSGCTCGDDFDCEVDFPNQGAVCIKGGDSCECNRTDIGRCARLCPTQV